MTNPIITYIKIKLKTKEGRRLLILEGIFLMIGIVGLLSVAPKYVMVPTYILLLTILYILWSMYEIIRKTKRSDK